MMPEITMGITNTVRKAVLKRILAVRPSASRKETTLTTRTVAIAKPNVNSNRLGSRKK